jgi:surface protein
MQLWDTSQVTDFSALFRGHVSFNSNELAKWDVSSGISFQNLFAGCRSFDQNLSVWNFSSAETFDAMFSGAISYNQPLAGGGWSFTSNLKSMAAMFKDALAFNGDVSGLDVSSVTDMNLAFYDAVSFEGIGIGAWNVAQVQRFDRMFADASAFDGDISDWNPAQATTFSGMFEDAVSFSQDLSEWRVSSDLVDASRMFYHAVSFNSSLCWANLNPRIHVDKMFCGSNGSLDVTCSNPSVRAWADSCIQEDARSVVVPSLYGGVGGSQKDTREEVEPDEEEDEDIGMDNVETSEELEDMIIRIQGAEKDESNASAVRHAVLCSGWTLLLLLVSLL